MRVHSGVGPGGGLGIGLEVGLGTGLGIGLGIIRRVGRATGWREAGRSALVAGSVLAMSLGGCTPIAPADGPPREVPSATPTISTIEPVPKVEPRSRYGNPPSYVVKGRRYHTLDSAAGYVEKGVASWYGRKFHGRRTSSGEPYDMYKISAAHRSLPLPSYAKVTHLPTGRSIVVRINDRGPFHDNRVIDLSYAAALKLGIVGAGTGYVKVEAIAPGDPEATSEPAVDSDHRTTGNGSTGNGGSVSSEVQLYLQVGAFENLNNALDLKRRLQATVVDKIELYEARVQGRAWYRVRLGPLSDIERADRLSKRFSELGLEPPRLVLE